MKPRVGLGRVQGRRPRFFRRGEIIQAEAPMSITQGRQGWQCTWFRLVGVLLGLALFGGFAAAQTVTGTISGTVQDSSGNVVAGAVVTLINEGTRDARTLTTNEAGDFRFTAVLPGNYTVKVEAKGFSSFERRGNVLTANEHLSVGELTLKVGAVSETVTTVAEGTPVQTESVEHSALVTSKQLELVSQRGRDVVSLLKILPGVAY